MQATLLSVGANLAQDNGKLPIDSCRDAVHAVSGINGIRLIAVSAWYRSQPVPPSAQPDYVNGVISIDCTLSPEDLLRCLHTLEASAGRVRGLPNAARTLDLDIIAMGPLVRSAPNPVLPHPRAHQRAFVLRPLLDVAPGWIHPALNKTAKTLLAALDQPWPDRIGP